jgi:hypothetical protein
MPATSSVVPSGGNRRGPIRTLAMVACCAEKGPARAPARELYRSPLFRLSLAYAEEVLGAEVRILSAKHGLVKADQEIEPYDLSLNDFNGWELADWAHAVEFQFADWVGARLSKVHDDEINPGGDLGKFFLHEPGLRVVLLAGAAYRFQPPLCVEFEEPMRGMGIGSRLGWLKRAVSVVREAA